MIPRAPTRCAGSPIIGERFYIDAAGKKWTRGTGERIWSRNLSMPKDGPPPGNPHAGRLDLANLLVLDDLPTGVIVGSAVIEKVTQGKIFYEWHLTDVERVERLRKPKKHPQPAWFRPF